MAAASPTAVSSQSSQQHNLQQYPGASVAAPLNSMAVPSNPAAQTGMVPPSQQISMANNGIASIQQQQLPQHIQNMQLLQQQHQQQALQQMQNGQTQQNGSHQGFAFPPGLDREKLNAMSHRMGQLRASGFTEQTSPELASITSTLNMIQRQMALIKQRQLQQAQQSQQQQQQGSASPSSAGPNFAANLPFNRAQPQAMALQNGQQIQQPPQIQRPSIPQATGGANGIQPVLNGTVAPAARPRSSSNGPISQQHIPPSSNANETSSASQQPANEPSAPTHHLRLTPQQMAAFKAQVYALRSLQKGQPIPREIANIIFNTSASATPPSTITGTDAVASPVALTPGGPNKAEPLALQPGLDALKSQPSPEKLATPPVPPKPPVEQAPPEPEIEIEEIPDTLIAPYNAYKNPRTLLAALKSAIQIEIAASIPPVTQVPSLLPPGIDLHTIQVQRNAYIEARIANRKKELENLPSTWGENYPTIPTVEDKENLASQKLRALIQLKSLNLLNKQKQMREEMVRGLNQASSLNLITDRHLYRATRRITLKDARTVDSLERQQKIDRENRAKQKHLDQLLAISKHARSLYEAQEQNRARHLRLGRNIIKWHAEAEKEEQKRIERISKERLKALKNNDEEAYLKLIDTAKDTRITHLIRQTDSFLDSLAQAVAAQQEEASDKDAIEVLQPQEGGGVDESAFGAAPVFQEEAQESKDKVDYYNVAHRIKETVTVQPSILTGGKLKDYQLKGLQWMISLYNNRLNGILADEMGLGKTIQTISLITYLIDVKKQNGPFLCIVPLSTLGNWTLEFAKWAPGVSVVIYKGSPPVRKAIQNQMRFNGFQVLLTTYEYIIKDRPFLARYKWIHMIIDEGHRMKNTQSKLSQTLTQYYSSRYRLILTGTPLQNNLPELWALLNFVLPKVFNSQKSFDEWFNTPFANTGGQDKIDLNEEEALLIIRRLHKVLRPFLLRRLKKDVESELPDKVERLIRCKMSALQTKLYKRMKETGMLITDDGKSTGSSKLGMKGLQNTIMQLRKICNHPFVFQQVEDLINPSNTSNALLYRVAGKFELLDRILPKLFKTGHRVLMFFQMTEIMNIMEDYLRFRHTEFLRLDGSTKPDERAELLARFNAPTSTIPIFLLSTRAGGLGLNLQTADTVIIYDSDWNPHQDLQAQDRAHRIGQKKEVRIFRLVTEKSIEEHILARAREKLEIDKKVIQGGRFDNKSSAAEREDFLRAILESNEEDDEETADLGDDEINDILARGEHEIETFTRMDIERKQMEEYNWRNSGNTGPTPERLISDAELPDVYHIEHVIDPETAAVLDSRRVKGVVRYDDGLTEEQWTAAIEDEVDLNEVIEQNRRRQAAVNAPRYTFGGEDEQYSDSERGGRADSTQHWESEMGSPGPGNKKRKRGPLGNSRATSVDTVSLNGDAKLAQSKRRKTGLDDPNRARLKEIMDACFEAVEDVDNEEEGHQCCGLFYKLPSKKDYPDYYLMILRPICMDQIQKKINKNQYASLDDFVADWKLMFANARTYNDDGSTVWKDANSMEAVFDAKLAELTSGSVGNSGAPSPISGVHRVTKVTDSDDE